jgi:hypothetical protein
VSGSAVGTAQEISTTAEAKIKPLSFFKRESDLFPFCHKEELQGEPFRSDSRRVASGGANTMRVIQKVTLSGDVWSIGDSQGKNVIRNQNASNHAKQ